MERWIRRFIQVQLISSLPGIGDGVQPVNIFIHTIFVSSHLTRYLDPFLLPCFKTTFLNICIEFNNVTSQITFFPFGLWIISKFRHIASTLHSKRSQDSRRLSHQGSHHIGTIYMQLRSPLLLKFGVASDHRSTMGILRFRYNETTKRSNFQKLWPICLGRHVAWLSYNYMGSASNQAQCAIISYTARN